MTARQNQHAWVFAYASAIGTSHVRTNTPCQDTVTCRILEDVQGRDVLFAAVSDGAGSAQCSQQGSQYVCDYFSRALANWLLDNEVGMLSVDQVHEWINNCRLSLQSIAEDAELRVRDYACTLVVAIVGEVGSAFFQIGDGAIVVAHAETTDAFEVLFWPQMGEYANTTNFITDDNIADSLNFAMKDTAIDELAVFTDGIQALVLHYATQKAHAPFFDRMLIELRTNVGSGYSERLSEGLQRFLASDHVNRKTDDDKSLILASRRRIGAAVQANSEYAS